jgi:hypothetical protein
MLPIRAKKDALRGLSPDFTGAFKLPPVSALYDALPLAFKPPLAFFPAFVCQAGDFISFSLA